MTQSGFSFVVLAFTGDKAAPFREDYIHDFDRMEAELRARPAVDPVTASTAVFHGPLQLLQLLGVYAERTIQLEGVVAEKDQALAIANDTIEEQAGTVAAHDRIAEADGTHTITVTAKHLDVKPGALFDYPRNKHAKVRWLYERSGGSTGDVAIKDRLDAEELSAKPHTVIVGRHGEEREKLVTRVRVTPKGLCRLARLIKQANDPLLSVPRDIFKAACLAKGHPPGDPGLFD